LWFEEYGEKKMSQYLNLQHLYLLPLLPIAVVVALSLLYWITALGTKIHNKHVIRVAVRAARKAEREQKSRYKLVPASQVLFRDRPAKRRPDFWTIVSRWFSVKIFLVWLVLSAGWSIGAISSRIPTATAQDCAMEFCWFALWPITGMLVFLSILCISGNEWRADDRPLSRRAWVSGKAFVSTALAFIITNATLLLYAKGWL